MTRTPSKKPVVILGGGLAGFAAAMTLVDHGFPVTVIEKMPVLGGRTASITVSNEDPVPGFEPGDPLDHGLHAWFPHYENLLRLMQRAGCLQNLKFQPAELFYYADDTGFEHIRVPSCPPPFHLFAMLLRKKGISFADKLKVLLGLGWKDIVWFNQRGNHRLDRESFAAWLKRKGFPPSVVRKVLAPEILSTTALPPEACSARTALSWLNYAHRRARNLRLGILLKGMTEGMVRPMAEYCRARGATLLHGTVRCLGYDPVLNRIRLESVDPWYPHPHFPAPPERALALDDEAVVLSALPFDALRDILPPELLLTSFFQPLQRMEWAPFVAVRLWIDRPLTTCQNFILSADTVFDVMLAVSNVYPNPSMTILDLVISNRQHFADVPLQEMSLHRTEAGKRLLERAIQDVQRVFRVTLPREAVRKQYIHLRKGILAQTVGSLELRLPQATPVDNLILAGDWTRHNANQCMEGAVVSGVLAANVLLRRAGLPEVPVLGPHS